MGLAIRERLEEINASAQGDKLGNYQEVISDLLGNKELQSDFIEAANQRNMESLIKTLGISGEELGVPEESFETRDSSLDNRQIALVVLRHLVGDVFSPKNQHWSEMISDFGDTPIYEKLSSLDDLLSTILTAIEHQRELEEGSDGLAEMLEKQQNQGVSPIVLLQAIGSLDQPFSETQLASSIRDTESSTSEATEVNPSLRAAAKQLLNELMNGEIIEETESSTLLLIDTQGQKSVAYYKVIWNGNKVPEVLLGILNKHFSVEETMDGEEAASLGGMYEYFLETFEGDKEKKEEYAIVLGQYFKENKEGVEKITKDFVLGIKDYRDQGEHDEGRPHKLLSKFADIPGILEEMKNEIPDRVRGIQEWLEVLYTYENENIEAEEGFSTNLELKYIDDKRVSGVCSIPDLIITNLGEGNTITQTPGSINTDNTSDSLVFKNLITEEVVDLKEGDDYVIVYDEDGGVQISFLESASKHLPMQATFEVLGEMTFKHAKYGERNIERLHTVSITYELGDFDIEQVHKQLRDKKVLQEFANLLTTEFKDKNVAKRYALYLEKALDPGHLSSQKVLDSLTEWFEEFIKSDLKSLEDLATLSTHVAGVNTEKKAMSKEDIIKLGWIKNRFTRVDEVFDDIHEPEGVEEKKRGDVVTKVEFSKEEGNILEVSMEELSEYMIFTENSIPNAEVMQDDFVITQDPKKMKFLEKEGKAIVPSPVYDQDYVFDRGTKTITFKDLSKFSPPLVIEFEVVGKAKYNDPEFGTIEGDRVYNCSRTIESTGLPDAGDVVLTYLSASFKSDEESLQIIRNQKQLLPDAVRDDGMTLLYLQSMLTLSIKDIVGVEEIFDISILPNENISLAQALFFRYLLNQSSNYPTLDDLKAALPELRKANSEVLDKKELLTVLKLIDSNNIKPGVSNSLPWIQKNIYGNTMLTGENSNPQWGVLGDGGQYITDTYHPASLISDANNESTLNLPVRSFESPSGRVFEQVSCTLNPGISARTNTIEISIVSEAGKEPLTFDFKGKTISGLREAILDLKLEKEFDDPFLKTYLLVLFESQLAKWIEKNRGILLVREQTSLVDIGFDANDIAQYKRQLDKDRRSIKDVSNSGNKLKEMNEYVIRLAGLNDALLLDGKSVFYEGPGSRYTLGSNFDTYPGIDTGAYNFYKILENKGRGIEYDPNSKSRTKKALGGLRFNKKNDTPNMSERLKGDVKIGILEGGSPNAPANKKALYAEYPFYFTRDDGSFIRFKSITEMYTHREHYKYADHIPGFIGDILDISVKKYGSFGDAGGYGTYDSKLDCTWILKIREDDVVEYGKKEGRIPMDNANRIGNPNILKENIYNDTFKKGICSDPGLANFFLSIAMLTASFKAKK